jgi:hypothetical protein
MQARRSSSMFVAALLGVACAWMAPTATARGGLAAPVRAGALGDSVTDEYQFADDPSDRQAARNFVEILASTHRADFGAFTTGDRGEPRRQGYAYNWARSGARTSALPTQTAGLSAQVAAGKVTYGFITIGGDDFRDVALGLADPQATVANGITRTVTAAQTLLAANPQMRLVIGNVPDITRTPEAQFALQQNPALAGQFAQLSGLIGVYDATLASQFAGDSRVALVDTNGLFNQILTNPATVVRGVALDTRVPGATPDHLFVDSIHPGTVGQGLLANAFIDALDGKFGEDVPRIGDRELLALARGAAGGGGPSAVPLPPAVMMGFAALPLMAVARYRLRRPNRDITVSV